MFAANDSKPQCSRQRSKSAKVTNLSDPCNTQRASTLLSLDQVFDKANRPRVLRRNFARLREAVATQKWKRGAKAKADAVAAVSLQRHTFRSLRQGVATAAASRVQRARADAFAARTLVTRGWTHLRDHPAEKKVMLI